MKDAKHTLGPWRIGKAYGAVVSDHPVTLMRGSDDVEAYGGHMVAESVAKNNLALVAAAPELLEALIDAVENPTDDAYWIAQARAAIAKATGATA